MIRPCPFGMWIWSRGELGAEKFGLELPISNSQSDMDPLLFFFLEKALLKELLSHPFFFLRRPASPSVAADCWLAVLQALERLLMLDTLSVESCRVILPSVGIGRVLNPGRLRGEEIGDGFGGAD